MVQEKLCIKWSPRQISDHLARTFTDREQMRVSPETIYQALYVQGRGHLRADLHQHLPTGRAVRRPRRSTSKGPSGKIPDMILISARPAEVTDRAVSGHWARDLILGSNCRSAIGTLVERQTRFVMLVHLPDGHGAVAVRDGLVTAIKTLPARLAKTEITERAQELLAGRIDAIRTLNEHQQEAARAREAADAADRAAATAWTAATAAGWTSTELRKLGLSQPTNRGGGRPKGSRNKLPAGSKTQATETGTTTEGQS